MWTNWHRLTSSLTSWERCWNAPSFSLWMGFPPKFRSLWRKSEFFSALCVYYDGVFDEISSSSWGFFTLYGIFSEEGNGSMYVCAFEVNEKSAWVFDFFWWATWNEDGKEVPRVTIGGWKRKLISEEMDKERKVVWLKKSLRDYQRQQGVLGRRHFRKPINRKCESEWIDRIGFFPTPRRFRKSKAR